jgi:NAD(P)-dependent dehydrogenase (short-subunit alcohol dehydrogenase family)
MARVAVITGAGSGIGRAVAQALAESGFAVVLSGRRAERLEETRAALAAGSAASVVTADVTDEASVAALFAAAVREHGRVDVLVNNAGIFGPRAALDEIELADWDAVVATNLTGAFLCAREAMRVMTRQDPPGGRIINNGSISAQVPRPLAAAYTATKHAITGLTKQIALEGRERGVACGHIDVGNAATEMTAALSDEPSIDVREVAQAVRYMALLPLEASVPQMTVMATRMPFAGRG